MRPIQKKLLSILLFSLSFAFVQAQVKEKHAFLEPADTFHKTRFWSLAGGSAAVYTGVTIGLYQLWYAGYPQSKFHFFNDLGEWKEIDKTGHFLVAYDETRAAYGAARWCGIERKEALWTAAGIGSLFQMTIEVMDGFSEKWGFSVPDVVFNTAGCGLFVGQELLWKEQRISLKVSAPPRVYPNAVIYSTDGSTSTTLSKRAEELYGSSLAEVLIKDYNAVTGWVSINPWSFMKNREETKFPRWLNVAVGYGADNLYAGYDNMWIQDGKTFVVDQGLYPEYRQYYLSLDVDFTRIRTNSRVVKLLLNVANVFKVPAPALEYTSLGKLKFHPIHW